MITRVDGRWCPADGALLGLIDQRWAGGDDVRAPRVVDRVALHGEAALVLVETWVGEREATFLVLASDDRRSGAEPGDEALAALTAARAGKALEGEHGQVRFVPGRAQLGPVSSARRLQADQSNTIDVVDEACLLKWYRRLDVSTAREWDVLAALPDALEHSAPPLYGALVWEGRDGRSLTLALVQGYVEDAQDGWDRLASGQNELGSAGDLEVVEQMGVTLADLHRGLRQADDARLDACARLTTALHRIEDVEHVVGAIAAAERLRGLPGDALPDLTAQQIHGDVHAGQYLLVGDRALLIDFEGDPLDDPSERSSPDTVLRDVAALRRSFVLLGAWRDENGLPMRAGFVEQARERMTAAYRRAYGDPDLSASAEAWLVVLEMEKAARELLYADRFLPSWMPIARAGLADATRRLALL